MKYFIKVCADWADEMDVYGCCIISKEKFDNIKSKVEKYFKNHYEMTIGIGSNEELIFENVEEVMDCFSIKEISNKEEEVLISLGLERFGELSVLDEDWWDYNEEEDEDYDY